MLKHQLTIPQWLSLPPELKNRLKELFDIPKSAGAQIMDQKLLSDGHTHDDLAHITVEKMQAFLETKEEDFWELMSQVLVKLNQEWELEKQMSKKEYEKMKQEQKERKAEALADLAQKMEEIANEAEQVMRPKRGRPRKATA